MAPPSCVSRITCSSYPSGASVLDDEECSSSSLTSEDIAAAAAIMPTGWLSALLPKKIEKSMPRVNFYVIFYVEAQYNNKNSRVGIECAEVCDVADPKSDQPDPVTGHRSGHLGPLWAVDFSRLAVKKSHLRSRFLEPLPEWDGPRVVRYPK